MTLTNHIKSKQCDEPIRFPSKFLQLAQNVGTNNCVQGVTGFWFCFSSVEKLALKFVSKSLSIAIIAITVS